MWLIWIKQQKFNNSKSKEIVFYWNICRKTRFFNNESLIARIIKFAFQKLHWVGSAIFPKAYHSSNATKITNVLIGGNWTVLQFILLNYSLTVGSSFMYVYISGDNTSSELYTASNGNFEVLEMKANFQDVYNWWAVIFYCRNKSQGNLEFAVVGWAAKEMLLRFRDNQTDCTHVMFSHNY